MAWILLWLLWVLLGWSWLLLLLLSLSLVVVIVAAGEGVRRADRVGDGRGLEAAEEGHGRAGIVSAPAREREGTGHWGASGQQLDVEEVRGAAVGRRAWARRGTNFARVGLALCGGIWPAPSLHRRRS
jgi:membrane protein implicated in regulation of membrane protease activity